MTNNANELIFKYEMEADTIVKSNANFNKSFSSQQAFIADETLKTYALSNLDEKDRENYRSGALHIHNLNHGFKIPYCHGGSLQALINQGIMSGDITSRPAKHLDSMVDHIANYLIISQQEFSGAQAFSDFNTLIAPFVRADKLGYRGVKQCLQRLVYNLSFGTRACFQTPFTNLTFNTITPKQLEDVPAIVGGKPQDSTYGDYEVEANLITEVINDILLEGDGSGRPFTFPLPTLNLTSKTDMNSSLFEKIIVNTIKKGSWYFMNYIGSGIDENMIRAMCCRLNLNLKELSQARGLWNISDGTGSLGVVSLNMGRVGYLSKKGLDIYDGLDELMQSARRILQVKRRMVQTHYDNGFMPFSKFFHLNLLHYFNTIGVVGFNEFFMNKTGDGTYCNLKEAGKLLDYMNMKIKLFQEEDGILYNLEMTPAEGSCYSLARLDKKQYGDEIFTQGTKDAPYYSSLLIAPKDNIWWTYKLKAEAQLLPKFSGGTVHRLYVAREDEPENIKWMIGQICKETVPYFDFSPTVAYCPVCETSKVGVIIKCSKCGSAMELWSRVVGFMKPVHKYNMGKTQEFWERTYIGG